MTDARDKNDAQDTVLLFDSGIGGLSVLSHIQAQIPDADIIYIADDARFPYGGMADGELLARVERIMERAIATIDPALVVIACNTASTIVMPALRARYSIPFVGIVPAIKPAAALSMTGAIAVLATPATVKRPYLRNLIDQFAPAREVRLVGAAHLAAQAEAYLQGLPINGSRIASDIAPCFFRHGGRRCDTIVLGCTHYPFLLRELVRLQSWPVRWLGPAHAVARRAASLLHEARARDTATQYDDPLMTNHLHARPGVIHFTSNAPVAPPLRAALDRYWLACAPLPFAL